MATAEKVCRIGDAVKAKYKVDGNLYGAHIAQTDGDFITVNWNDGGADHRSIHKKDVFKNGVSCDLSAGRPMLCFGIANPIIIVQNPTRWCFAKLVCKCMCLRSRLRR